MSLNATQPPRGSHTIRLPIDEETYAEIIDDPQRFRQWLDQCFQEMPELFPKGFDQGYGMKDVYVSRKLQLKIRRIELRDGTAYTVHPSFVMPYLSGRTDEVERALFLRRFSVPFWGLAWVFGKDPDYWCRLELSLGRLSVAGTTVRNSELPQDLLADEHHQPRDGEKNYIATTVGGGCCLGAEVAPTASTEDLAQAYGVFRKEAQDIDPDYAPSTVNTDGWAGTQAAWQQLFPTIVVLQCFLHAWLKIRERAKHLEELFFEIGQQVWHAYRSPDRPTFSQRLRRLREFADEYLLGMVWEKVMDLCNKRELWKIAYDYPEGHRTSNMLDRVMRSMNRYFDAGQHLHGRLPTSCRHVRAWCLLYNFAPWSPAAVRANEGWRSPAERLNARRYHESWLQNLLISGSLGGYRDSPQKP